MATSPAARRCPACPARSGSNVSSRNRTLETAKALIATGGNLWNSGMFVFRADTLLAELERLAPEVLTATRAAMAARSTDLDFIRLGTAEFAAGAGHLHRLRRGGKNGQGRGRPRRHRLVGCRLLDGAGRDRAQGRPGNVALGDVVLEDVANCYVRSDGTLTAVLGVRDLIVVTTQDAVLVAAKDQAQNVKKIVDRLKAQKRPEADSHNRTYRPWGFYESLIQGDRFQVKRIVVWPGRKLSLQKHFHRAEHWVVVAGSAAVTCDDEVRLLRENESVYLPLGCMHRLENPGKIPLTVIEVQSGAYLGEDDIVRFEDTYGRQ